MEQVSNIIKNNVNDNVKINKSNNEQCNNDNVERIARQLCEKFGSDKSWSFYCKVAYKLPEYVIWGLYEQTQQTVVKSPGGLFNWLCRREMQRNG